MKDNSLLVISQHFFPSSNSTGQLLTDLILGLDKRGYSIEVFTSTPAILESCVSIPSSIKVNRVVLPIEENSSIFTKALVSILFMMSGLRFILASSPSKSRLLVVSNPPYSGILGLIFKVFKKGDFFFLFQDIFPDSAVLSKFFSSNSIPYKVFSALIFVICKYANQVIVLTADMASFLERKYPSLVTSKNIRVIENWSIESINQIKKSENYFAKEYLLDKKFTILYSGNIGRLHDIETIGKAITSINQENIQFVFIGNGPKIKILEELIDKKETNNLLLLPFQERKALPYTLTSCDLAIVSLLPGAESIVAPCKLYGMLAAGRGIIAISESGSYIDKLLNQYECGINCPPGDVDKLIQIILSLAQKPVLVKKWGINAHNLFLHQYQAKRAIYEYEALLFK